MHADFRHLGTPLDRVIEETGEVLQRIGKIQRFGWKGSNPLLPVEQRVSNEDGLRAEISDLEAAIGDLKRERGW